MVKRCVVGNCNNSNLTGSTMHLFPRDRTYRQKWERFVRQGRAHWTHATSTSVICGAHFVTPDDFEGYQQWSMGYKRQLDLKKAQFPLKYLIAKIQKRQHAVQLSQQRHQQPPYIPQRRCLASVYPDTSAMQVGDRSKKRTRTDSAIRKLSVARVCKLSSCFNSVVLSCCSGRIIRPMYNVHYLMNINKHVCTLVCFISECFLPRQRNASLRLTMYYNLFMCIFYIII